MTYTSSKSNKSYSQKSSAYSQAHGGYRNLLSYQKISRKKQTMKLIRHICHIDRIGPIAISKRNTKESHYFTQNPALDNGWQRNVIWKELKFNSIKLSD